MDENDLKGRWGISHLMGEQLIELVKSLKLGVPEAPSTSTKFQMPRVNTATSSWSVPLLRQPKALG
jgi:hypothetical protein